MFAIEAPGKVLSSVVLTEATEVQPLLPVTVTVNVPSVFTATAAVVAPVYQRSLPVPLPVNVVDGMVQFRSSPLLFAIDAPGKVLSSVVDTLAVDVQPLVPVTVTVNVPAVFRIIAAVVAPGFQR